MVESSTDLSGPSIRSMLRAGLLGKDLHLHDLLDSTQRAAVELAAAGAQEGTTVIADGQTAGVGRGGRAWHSPRGMGVWLSLVLRPRLEPRAAGLISVWAAVSVAEVLEAVGLARVGIKWPNDVLVGGKKVCGVLTQSSVRGRGFEYAVVGIGLNTSQGADDFPPELQGKATSVALELGRRPDRSALAAALLNELDSSYAALNHPEGAVRLAARATSLSVLRGKKVRVKLLRGSVVGVAAEIAPDGALILERDSERLAVHAGEVSVVRPEEPEK